MYHGGDVSNDNSCEANESGGIIPVSAQEDKIERTPLNLPSDPSTDLTDEDSEPSKNVYADGDFTFSEPLSGGCAGGCYDFSENAEYPDFSMIANLAATPGPSGHSRFPRTSNSSCMALVDPDSFRRGTMSRLDRRETEPRSEVDDNSADDIPSLGDESIDDELIEELMTSFEKRDSTVLPDLSSPSFELSKYLEFQDSPRGTAAGKDDPNDLEDSGKAAQKQPGTMMQRPSPAIADSVLFRTHSSMQDSDITLSTASNSKAVIEERRVSLALANMGRAFGQPLKKLWASGYNMSPRVLYSPTSTRDGTEDKGETEKAGEVSVPPPAVPGDINSYGRKGPTSTNQFELMDSSDIKFIPFRRASLNQNSSALANTSDGLSDAKLDLLMHSMDLSKTPQQNPATESHGRIAESTEERVDLKETSDTDELKCKGTEIMDGNEKHDGIADNGDPMETDVVDSLDPTSTSLPPVPTATRDTIETAENRELSTCETAKRFNQESFDSPSSRSSNDNSHSEQRVDLNERTPENIFDSSTGDGSSEKNVDVEITRPTFTKVTSEPVRETSNVTNDSGNAHLSAPTPGANPDCVSAPTPPSLSGTQLPGRNKRDSSVVDNERDQSTDSVQSTSDTLHEPTNRNGPSLPALSQSKQETKNTKVKSKRPRMSARIVEQVNDVSDIRYMTRHRLRQLKERGIEVELETPSDFKQK